MTSCFRVLLAMGLRGHGPARLVAVLGVCAGLLISHDAWTHAFVVDQHNDAVLTTQGYVLAAGGIGQEFTPTISLMDVVELEMNSQSSTIGGTAFVQIRKGTIAGPILGVSQSVSIPPITLPLTLAHFDFPAPVVLTPGIIQVIEVVGGNLGVFTSGFGNNTYPGGAAIFMGVIQPDADLWFREGFSGATAVEKMTWGRMKTLYR